MLEPEIIQLAQKIWDYHHLNHPLRKADCILGLGSYDLRVAEHCAGLYLENWASSIIFSGGLGNWTKTIWNRSEAEIFRDHIANYGIPAEKILLEKNSSNIGENFVLTKKLLTESQIKPGKIIVATKPNTERRAYATYKKVWPELDIIISSPKISFAAQPNEHIPLENLIHEMVGDLQRIREYSKLGYQIPQEIPHEVWEAYEKLVSYGFDQHLIKKCA